MRRALPDRFCCDDDLCWIGSDGLHADDDLDAWRSGRLHDATRQLTDVEGHHDPDRKVTPSPSGGTMGR